MRKLVIFGTGRFGEIAHYYFTKDSTYDVAGFTVDRDYLSESSFRGLPVVAFEDVEASFPPDRFEMFVALGIRSVNRIRAARVEAAEARGYGLASFVSSRAGVSAELVCGPNTMIMEGAGIQPFVEIGRDTIIWPATRIGFHTRIGDHCWIACAAFGESVTVGDYSFIGINATIAPGVSIGRGNVIGAGAVVLSDTKDFEVHRAATGAPLQMPSGWLDEF